MTRFSPEVEYALTIAKSKSAAKKHHTFGAPHLLLGLLHDSVGISKSLSQIGKDVQYLREWADVRIDLYKNTKPQGSEITPDDTLVTVFNKLSVIHVTNEDNGVIQPEVLFNEIITPGVFFSHEQLRSLSISVQEFSPFVKRSNKGTPRAEVNNVSIDQGSVESMPLPEFIKDMVNEAKEGIFEPVVARENEKRQLAEFLGQKNSPSVFIVGNPGVGKTAIIQGIAQDILFSKAPKHLQHSYLFRLDVNTFLSGTNSKSEIENRFNKMVSYLVQLKDAILFIDEAHQLFDNKVIGFSGFANQFKTAVTSEKLRIIASTSFTEYRKVVEPDEAFVRRFSLLKIEEPTDENAILMLSSQVPSFEKHHNLQISDEIPAKVVFFAKRFFRESSLPSSAIKLLDQTMSAIRMVKDTMPVEMERIFSDIHEMQNNPEKSGELILYILN